MSVGEQRKRAVVCLAGAGLVLALGCTTGVSSSMPPPTTTDDGPAWDIGFDLPGAVPEGPDDFGNGQDGELVVTADTVVNTCVPVSSASGDTVEAPGAAGISVGRRILVWQLQDVFATSGPSMPVEQAGRAGKWEVVRVESVNGGSLRVTPGLQTSYQSGAGATAQLCTLPEYTDVTVAAGARILAEEWDGQKGGVAAFYASGSLALEGGIDVSGSGFRGGALRQNTSTDDVKLENTSGGDGGGKGEGMDGLSWALDGRGAMANAGGGGNGHNAGGGGGANGGAGGWGGKQAQSHGDEPDTAGRAGGRLELGSGTLSFGGGGGAGHQDDDQGGPGGDGGGVIWLAARSLEGSGAFVADGLAGGDSSYNGNGDGAGGGGAGGTIEIVTAASTFAGTIHAAGAAGGDSVSDGTHGPGGGGSGGRALLSGLSVVPVLDGGLNGLNANGNPWGATAGGTGTATAP